MRTIRWTSRFKKDVKREMRGLFRNTLQQDLNELTALLEADTPLPPRYRDHALSGNWLDHRDCHIHPDLVIIYRKPDIHLLELVLLGSHSELELYLALQLHGTAVQAPTFLCSLLLNLYSLPL